MLRRFLGRKRLKCSHGGVHCKIPGTNFNFLGDPVRKVAGCILLALVCLSISVPSQAKTRLSPEVRAAQKNAKKQEKAQKKLMKAQQKDQKKALKDWKKHHPNGY